MNPPLWRNLLLVGALLATGIPAMAAPSLASPAVLADGDAPKPAEEKKPAEAKDDKKADAKDEKKDDKKKDELDDFEEVTKDTEKIEGLLTFYKKKDKLFMEIKPEQLDRDYLLTITQESGIGARGVYNGMPLQDYLFRFRRVEDNIHFVNRNTSFRAKPGLAVNRSLDRAFADSVLVSMKLESVHPESKNLLVEVSPLFKGDLPNLAGMLRGVMGSGYNLDPAKTYYGKIKSFPLNTELQTYYGFNTGDPKGLDTLPDSRNVTLRIHYSLSQLPDDHYRPRMADERIGYFLTAYQDFSSDETVEPYVRYINRWRLEKKDPDALLSEPKKPIVFWLENTIPVEYRDAIRHGILHWNPAFEKAGFKNAIEVKQQPDDADWDAADVRYNTIRWINTVDAAFAMGPSRVNPLTGEILDADIVVDANFVRYVKYSYRRDIANTVGQVFGQPDSLKHLPKGYEHETFLHTEGLPVLTPAEAAKWGEKAAHHLCMAGPVKAQEAQLATTALALNGLLGVNGEVPKEFLDSFWADLMAHEVGHTLGLRHNFHSSTLIPLDQLHNKALVAEKGLYSSVMDYNPVNIAIDPKQQGYYHTPRVGPYDDWVIEYGYKPITAADSEGEVASLRLIAQRGTHPDLAYATDEEVYDMGGPTSIDPLVNSRDLSSDPIGFSRERIELSKAMLKKLEQRGFGNGESYSAFRRNFGGILGMYSSAGYHLSKWVGGQHFTRNHIGDPGGTLPFTPVPAAKQREALTVIRQHILAEDAFKFNPDTLNKLAPAMWSHWGQYPSGGPADYPILEVVENLQWNSIARMFHPATMRRIRNMELKVKNPKDAFTLSELFTGVTNTLWSEALTGPRNITTSRRAIQRGYLDMLIGMVVKPQPGTPDDARVLARSEIKRVQAGVRRALAPQMPLAAVGGGQLKSALQTRPVVPLDAITKAYLEDADARITQALNAAVITQ